jgi:magnesium-transporting ATPase (P-type)
MVLNYRIFVNTLFTGFPISAIGGFDKDLKPSTLLHFPQLFKMGIDGQASTLKSFMLRSFEAVYHAIVLYFLTVYGLADCAIAGKGQFSDGNTISIVLLLYTGCFLLN